MKLHLAVSDIQHRAPEPPENVTSLSQSLMEKPARRLLHRMRLTYGPAAANRGTWFRQQGRRNGLCSWEWDTIQPPLSYLQQCGTAGKNLYRAHLAAGRGSRDKVCLWCWALLSSLALCLDPVPQHHWWRCGQKIGQQTPVRSWRLKVVCVSSE